MKMIAAVADTMKTALLKATAKLAGSRNAPAIAARVITLRRWAGCVVCRSF